MSSICCPVVFKVIVNSGKYTCFIIIFEKVAYIALIAAFTHILGQQLLFNNVIQINEPHLTTNIVGLFVEEADSHIAGVYGLFKGGGWYLLGVQLFTCVVVIAWTMATSFILLKVSKNFQKWSSIVPEILNLLNNILNVC